QELHAREHSHNPRECKFDDEAVSWPQGTEYGIAVLGRQTVPGWSVRAGSCGWMSRREPLPRLVSMNHVSNRIDPFSASPEAVQAMLDLEKKVKSLGLEPSLIQLVKTRASLLNGCGFCLHMHTRDARAAGETEERLYLLGAWRESPLFTARERAALAWT